MKITSLLAVCLALLLTGMRPARHARRISLGGVDAPVPTDWRFTDDNKEIAVQVHTPYLIPHAVTIWCAQVDGELYVGASAPKTKHWPGWVDDNPDVTLRIGENTYAVRLVPLDDPNVTAACTSGIRREVSAERAGRRMRHPTCVTGT